MKNNVTKINLSIILYLCMILVNTLAAFGFINSMSQRAVSAKYNTLITPAGFTFSIWGVIYLLLLVTLLIARMKVNEDYYKKLVEQTSAWFWVSCIANILWNVAFSYGQIHLSFLLIVVIHIGLSAILRKLLQIHQKGKVLAPLSFAIYGGWIHIASFVNFYAFLISIDQIKVNLQGSVEIYLSYALIIGVLITVVLAMRMNKNAAFTLPIIWALFGIFSKLRSMQDGSGLINLMLIAMALLAVITVIRFVKNDKCILPHRS